MPTPPLPASSCVRVKLDYNLGEAGEMGSRFYLSYSGSAPSGANCTTLAGDIAAAFNTDLTAVISSQVALQEVDVLDIATTSGLSGQWSGSHGGLMTGSNLPFQVATNVEFNIARRYRGGKPRMYLPQPDETALLTDMSYTPTFTGNVHTAFVNFMAAVVASSVGSMGTLAHVNLSYYDGFNTTTPPWRGPGFKYPPKYRTAALLDTISGYSVKSTLGSQKRRRTATTP